jgi:hypothetical protein
VKVVLGPGAFVPAKLEMKPFNVKVILPSVQLLNVQLIIINSPFLTLTAYQLKNSARNHHFVACAFSLFTVLSEAYFFISTSHLTFSLQTQPNVFNRRFKNRNYLSSIATLKIALR